VTELLAVLGVVVVSAALALSSQTTPMLKGRFAELAVASVQEQSGRKVWG
jgi:hypothetical protein